MNRLCVAYDWSGAALPEGERAWVEVEAAGDEVEVRVDAPLAGDPPPPGPPGPTPGLWNYEVVELFITGDGSEYLEIELSPWGHHLVLRLDGIRKPFAQALPMEVRWEGLDERWTAVARLPRAWLPAGPLRANAYRIHGASPRVYQLATPLPGAQPDFHQPAAFEIMLDL